MIFPTWHDGSWRRSWAFRRPHVPGELWKKLQDTQFDKSKKLRIIRFVHTHSHSDRIGDPEHDPSLLGEARSVLDDILAFIKAEDPGHFDAMVEVVESTDESDRCRITTRFDIGRRPDRTSVRTYFQQSQSS